jgi:protein-S-isoprenylcysteine O-methyltransferase Ste14
MRTSLFIKQLLGTLLFFAVIFICAGRLMYWQGLVFALTGVFMLVLNYTALRPDAELMQERSKPGAGSKSWDKGVLALSLLATISMYVVAGLDSGRFHWSPEFGPGLYALGIILNTTGQLLFLIAQKQNRFFSSTVRIQTDRGHAVCKTGLYKFVRHPAYLGIIVQSAGFPLFFGSLWSIIPAGSLIILNVLRAYLEDKTLKNELKGYPEYMTKTRYRLIPLLW